MSATLDRSTFVLTIVGEQLLSEIDIQINYMWYSYTVTPTITDDQYVYQIPLSDYASFITQSTEINVKPSSIDEYNSYNGSETVVEII